MKKEVEVLSGQTGEEKRKLGETSSEINDQEIALDQLKEQSEQKRDADGQVTTYKISETSIPSFQGYEGKIFYDLKTGRLFKKQGTQFVAVVDINAE